MLDRREALHDPVGDGAREPFEQQSLTTGEHLAYELGQAPVVDGVLDPVGVGCGAAHVDPEIDEEALP